MYNNTYIYLYIYFTYNNLLIHCLTSLFLFVLCFDKFKELKVFLGSTLCPFFLDFYSIYFITPV